MSVVLSLGIEARKMGFLERGSTGWYHRRQQCRRFLCAPKSEKRTEQTEHAPSRIGRGDFSRRWPKAA